MNDSINLQITNHKQNRNRNQSPTISQPVMDNIVFANNEISTDLVF